MKIGIMHGDDIGLEVVPETLRQAYKRPDAIPFPASAPYSPQMATLGTRVPFLHFFDGFRTSHEVAKLAQLETSELRAMIETDVPFAA